MKSTKLRPKCSTCHVRQICFNNLLLPDEVQALENIITEIKLIERGEYICHANDPIKRIYAVFTGIAKEFHLDNNGKESITEFYLPGDVIGLEVLSQPDYQFNIIATQATAVCALSVSDFKNNIDKLKFLGGRALELISQRLIRISRYHLTTNARARAAVLLLDIIERLQQRNKNTYPVTLPMSQVEMSHRLGMANETFNRILHDFMKSRVIDIKKGVVFSCNKDALHHIAGFC